MKEDYLIVVDMQKDFIDGSLGTAEARAIVPSVIAYVNSFKGTVIFTQDTHERNYLQTQEGKNLPVVHCVRGTSGWNLEPVLDAFANRHGCRIFTKGTFGSLELASYLRNKYVDGRVASVTLLGLCTDICVVSNAMLVKSFLPEVPVSVVASCSAGVTPERHKEALDVMSSCQITIK